MSHTVIRGQPYPSQLYLDGILDEILTAKGIPLNEYERSRLGIAQILYHCLKKNPRDVFIINGASSEFATNEEILRKALSLARAMVSKGLRGKTIMVMIKNHQRVAVMYCAVLFAGVIPFMMDPHFSTIYEITHFLKLLAPTYIFCDTEHYSDVQASLSNVPDLVSNVIVFDNDEILDEFIAGSSEDLDGFELAETSPNSPVLLLPTSGSTGLPKATLISNKGIVAHLPTSWIYHSKFPKPTDLVLLLSSLQWVTFTMKITTCPVYRIPLLVSPKRETGEHVSELFRKFRPTWTFLGPAFAKELIEVITPEELSSLETLILLGVPPTKDVIDEFKKKLPKDCRFYDAYGSTEAQGFATLPDPETPMESVGKVINIYDYKIVDENGIQLGPGNTGELYIKGISIVEGYHETNEECSAVCTEDGWYRTNDEFYFDHEERLYFQRRLKFNFKYLEFFVSPEEVEAVISQVPGVHQSLVVGTEKGPAAAVKLLNGCRVTRDQIHEVVNTTLPAHKRLDGGIAFVDSLPRTHSGKIQRWKGKSLIMDLIKNGQCY